MPGCAQQYSRIPWGSQFGDLGAGGTRGWGAWTSTAPLLLERFSVLV